MRRLLDFDPLTGLKTFHEYDDVEKTTQISYEQDVGEVLKLAHTMRTADTSIAKMKKRDSWHAAVIPDTLVIKWRNEGIDIYNPQHYKKLAGKLNDPDYAYLRTWPGRI